VTFLEQRKASSITQKLALEWAQQPPNARPAYWAARLSFVRGFARYRSATDPRTQIPPMALLPFKPKRARPYLYSDEEIRSLLRAALRMPYRFERWKLRPWVYYCLFGLLSVSGLRLGEAGRSTQSRSSKCRSKGSSVDDPRRQVRQDSPGAVARNDR
jgi:integrase/recombinase XerD